MDVEKHFSDKALEDFKLIDLAVGAGNQKAYSELMKKYKKSVYHVILKMVRNTEDAEDLTIEAFGKAFKNLGKFKKDFAFSTWLFRIATNNCIDFLRKKRLDTMSLNSSFFKDDNGASISIDIQAKTLNPQEETIKQEKIKIMRMLVDKLPDRYQTLVKLRYFNEWSYDEIAKELESPLGTIKAQLHRSRELLYDLVEAEKDSI
jgi:RNA polymerase sigma factor (sigma-70 family)